MRLPTKLEVEGRRYAEFQGVSHRRCFHEIQVSAADSKVNAFGRSNLALVAMEPSRVGTVPALKA